MGCFVGGASDKLGKLLMADWWCHGCVGGDWVVLAWASSNNSKAMSCICRGEGGEIAELLLFFLFFGYVELSIIILVIFGLYCCIFHRQKDAFC